MLRLSWLVGVVRSKVGCGRAVQAQRLGWVLTMLLLGALTLPAGAAAATCTDTWTGPEEGRWETAENWSLGTVPTSTEVACIGPKTTVTIIVPVAVGVLQDEGALTLSGTLEVTNSLEASSVKTMSLTGGLKGAGTVDISSSLTSGNSAMYGPGVTVIQPGATATIGTSGFFIELSGRKLVNEGAMTLVGGSIIESESAELLNSGTLTINAEIEAGIEGGSGAGKVVNTGTLTKTKGTGPTILGVTVENLGTIDATTGSFQLRGYAIWKTASTLEGSIEILGGGEGEGVSAQNATVKLEFGTLAINGSTHSKFGGLILVGGTFTGTGTVEISSSLITEFATLHGTGSLIILHGATATLGPNEIAGGLNVAERTIINFGVMTLEHGLIDLEGAQIINFNTFKADSEPAPAGSIEVTSGKSYFQNYGLLEKTVGSGKTKVDPFVESLGAIVVYTGKIEFSNAVRELTPAQFAARSPSAPHQPRSNCGDPINCAIGNFYQTQADLSVGGRGVGLNLTRTYNSQGAVEGTTGIFGHGWSSSFTDHVVAEKEAVTVYHDNGSAVPFSQNKGGEFIGPNWTQDKLTGSSTVGYSLILANQIKYEFEGSTGRLQIVTDRNGNETKLGYNKAGQLEAITDPAGRKITLAYNGEGLVESAKDPLGHTVKYTYEGGALASVTLPGESKARWKYHYDEAHQMTSMTDGRGGETTNEYNGGHQVISQTDPAGRKLKFEYEGFETTITNNSTGSVTAEWFNSNDEPTSITRGFGTKSASTETLSYDLSGNLTSKTDGNEHTTNWTYDGEGNMTSEINPDKDQTKWTYNGTHDVLTATNPNGETTTIVRDSRGNAETVSRPAPGKTTQTTTYHYNTNGQLTSTIDPLKNTQSYEYDAAGNRTSEADPEGDKRTFAYNEDSQMKSMVSPNGNVKGAEAAQYTTKIERDSQGRPTTVTDPLGHTTKHAYDANGNLETLTDANGNATTYVYNGDNQITAVKSPNGNTAETEYDGAGRVVGEIDGNKHTTTYVRNVLGEVIEVKDPLGRVKTMEYDAAGNLIGVLDAAKRKTTYSYDPANRLLEIGYSDGETPTVKYEYDADGNRTKMIDGTGTTTYVYDVLDRLVSSTDGHGEGVAYEYDLAGNQTKLTYPSGNLLTRAYDNAGRLQSVTDWLKNTTTFAYNANSDLITTTLPKATGVQDKTFYNQTDQVMKITMVNGTKAFASLAYIRDNDGQVKTTITTGLPGTEKTSYGYDTKNRLTSAGASTYEYDAGDNPTKLGSNNSVYDAANQLKTSASTIYGYDQLGERTSATTKAGLTTTYGYDQAGNLNQVKQNKLTGVNVLYTYDGNGIRAAQTKGKGTTNLTWDVRAGLPLLLSDEQNSYVYGPDGVPIEQVSSKGTVLYLHQDQQDSTRALTGSNGATEATMTYDAYGNLTGSTGTASTPLGYDGQYTNTDTGLIYMRLRTYDPATAQFMSVDPIASITRARYAYAYDNPLYYADPTGLGFFSDVATYAGAAALIPGVDAVAGPVALISGGIAVAQDATEGEYGNAAADASGVVLGLSGVLEKEVAAEATDDVARQLFDSSESGQGPILLKLELVGDINKTRQRELELASLWPGLIPPEDPGALAPILKYLELIC